MKKILIATRNKDKSRIVSKLLNPFFNDYTFYNLNDIEDEIIDKPETGDVINRSYEKAKNTFDCIKNNDYEYIIGVDDGIKIKNEMIEKVKDYIKPIIDDKLLEKDEIVYIVRAYTFINTEGKKYSILTEIPFKYKKLNYTLEIKKDTYPLSHVLTPMDSDLPVIEINPEKSNEYYTKYSKDRFLEVQEYFND